MGGGPNEAGTGGEGGATGAVLEKVKPSGEWTGTSFVVFGLFSGLIGWLMISQAEGVFAQGIAFLVAIQFWLISAVWFVGAGIIHTLQGVQDFLGAS